jgi:hypothetical protein
LWVYRIRQQSTSESCALEPSDLLQNQFLDGWKLLLQNWGSIPPQGQNPKFATTNKITCWGIDLLCIDQKIKTKDIKQIWNECIRVYEVGPYNMHPFICPQECRSKFFLAVITQIYTLFLKKNPCKRYSMKHKTQGNMYLGVGKFPSKKNLKIY